MTNLIELNWNEFSYNTSMGWYECPTYPYKITKRIDTPYMWGYVDDDGVEHSVKFVGAPKGVSKNTIRIKKYTEYWYMPFDQFKEYFLDNEEVEDEWDEGECVEVEIGYLKETMSPEGLYFSLRWRVETMKNKYSGRKLHINNSSCFALMMCSWVPDEEDDSHE